MGLKPVIKARSSRQRVAEWIVSRFPENYRDLAYVEPFLGDGSVLLCKDPSSEEVVSDSDRPLMSVWRALRDEQAFFCSRVKRMKHCRSTFEKILRASGGDYMDEAVREFVLRQMSRGAEKKSYLPQNSEVRCADCWCGLFERVPAVSERVAEVFMLDRDGLEVLKTFDREPCLVFCDPPELEASNSSYHLELGGYLANMKGKAVVCARNSAMYKRMLSDWNRRGLPGSRSESIWTNF